MAADSQVETFAALKFTIDNECWHGVPFYIRVGKRLPVTATEVLVRFNRLSRPVLDEKGPPPGNYYRFRLTPDMVLALGTNVKRSGEEMVGETTELVAHHRGPDEMEAYELLLTAAANGDPTLFAREDAVEQSWRIIDRILGNVVPVCEYEPNTWGPAECSALRPKAAGTIHSPNRAPRQRREPCGDHFRNDPAWVAISLNTK